ncbi:fatty acyl-AMP ligase [Streptomyces sp. NPDC003077]|uniref:fatty acyl-AMP ligase n=1 Tax=Streptomyces sp. NPDC003077 TaxID=3154443 RepID=UPI0033AD6E33
MNLPSGTELLTTVLRQLTKPSAATAGGTIVRDIRSDVAEARQQEETVMSVGTSGAAPEEVATVLEALGRQVGEQPDRTAYVFLRDGEEVSETVTYRQLDEVARMRARRLRAAGLGDRRALLLYPAGLEFVRTLVGCMYARVAAVPVPVPHRQEAVRALRCIAHDAGTTTVLTTAEVKAELENRFAQLPELRGLTLVATDNGAPALRTAGELPEVNGGDLALLQYTSGSTGVPKGVMVSHANLLTSAAQTEQRLPLAADGAMVSWLPHFHDMGMMFGIVMPLYAGVPAYLMPPQAFIRRPARWPEAMARFGATHSAAPSFAYELCARAAAVGEMSKVGDLSRWRYAANGAEPVRLAAIDAFAAAFAPYGFDRRAMCPGYGLAENTLTATVTVGGRGPGVLWLSAAALCEGRAEQTAPHAADATALVSSGPPVRGTEVRIVDPVTRHPLPEGTVGEIWVSGPSVTAGYWNKPLATEDTFRARPADQRRTPLGRKDAEHAPVRAASAYLRTGDLGFLHAGELYVAGRLKDVIIHQGRNHYPQDIELSAERAVPGLHPNAAVAFSVDDGERERLVLAVEADGRVLKRIGAQGVRERVSRAVRDGHRLYADEVLVVRRGTLSRTTSGKIQRQACRRAYEAGLFAGAEDKPRTAAAPRRDEAS